MSQRRDPAMYGLRARPGGAGWNVVLVRRGVTIQRNFSVARYGDATRALAAAQAWRDATALRTPAQTLRQASRKLRPNNSSGHAGVHRVERAVQRQGGEMKTHVYWLARTPRDVQPPRSRSFAVSRYGEQGAYDRAVTAREGFIQLLSGCLLQSVPRALHPSAYLASQLEPQDRGSPATHDM